MANIFSLICFNYQSGSKHCNDSHTSTQQQLTVLLQRHSVPTGVSTAWLQMAQPNSPNKICTEYTSVLPAGKSSSTSGLNVSSPLLAAQQWGNTKGYHFSLAMSLAPSGSHSAGELILFICCGYLRNNLWRQAGFQWVKEQTLCLMKRARTSRQDLKGRSIFLHQRGSRLQYSYNATCMLRSVFKQSTEHVFTQLKSWVFWGTDTSQLLAGTEEVLKIHSQLHSYFHFRKCFWVWENKGSIKFSFNTLDPALCSVISQGYQECGFSEFIN